MSLFMYPDAKHVRTLTPRLFKRYRTYKRYLQHEFSRICIYCRQPDSSVPSLIFTVEHYRPSGLAQFAHLLCDYSNLFYACHSCNSRKSNDWPANDAAARVVNPCDDVMSEHLRFQAKTGRIAPQSRDGEHMEELLQLNDDERVEYRRTTIAVVNNLQLEIVGLSEQEAKLKKKLSNGQISQQDFDTEIQEIVEDRDLLRTYISRANGTKALPPLPNRKLGIQLHP